MKEKSIVYYGYDSDTYKSCIDFIKSTNRKHIEIITIWFIAINIVYLLCSIFGWADLKRDRIGFYSIFLGLGVVFELLLIFLRKFLEKYHLLMVYASIVTLMSYSIMSSNAKAYQAATIFLVFIVVVALSYIDNMVRMSAVLVLSTLVLIFYSRSIKPASIASQDLFNAFVFLSLALVLHYYFQRARMSQFETYQKNIQIQRELEVKSSFDALTSLLNRGRFFSMAGQVLKAPHENEQIAVGLLDLDGFKQINDTLGHQMGDKVIQMAGKTILDTLEIDLSEKWTFPERAIQDKLCFAGRLGGDEFIVMIRGKSMDEIRTLMTNMLRNLNSVQFGELNGIRASIGVTEITASDFDIDKAYNRVDAGLYESKRGGKNRVTFVDDM